MEKIRGCLSLQQKYCVLMSNTFGRILEIFPNNDAGKNEFLKESELSSGVVTSLRMKMENLIFLSKD